MNLGKRIKKVRKEKDLTQQQFAARIGTTANVLTNYETGRRNPSSSVINNICKTFNVNEDWLRTGVGEMINPTPSAALDALSREYGLTYSDYVIIEKFLNLNPTARISVAEYMLEVAAALNSNSIPIESVSSIGKLDIDTETALYHNGLIIDEKLASKSETEQRPAAPNIAAK